MEVKTTVTKVNKIWDSDFDFDFNTSSTVLP